jgi:probable phosphoglycerate mutase
LETLIYLLRHGSIQGTEIRRYLGQTDVPLDEAGLRQAKWWRTRLGRGRFSRVYASDLSRTMDTARIVAGKETPVIAVPQLREINLGSWEGLSIEEVRQREPELYAERGRDIAVTRAPGGESYADVLARAYPVFEKIASEAKDEVLIVSHSGTIRAILCELLGMPLQNVFRIAVDYAGLSLLAPRNGGFVLTALNQSPPAA